MKKYGKCQVCFREDAICGMYQTIKVWAGNYTPRLVLFPRWKKRFVFVGPKCEKKIGDENVKADKE